MRVEREESEDGITDWSPHHAMCRSCLYYIIDYEPRDYAMPLFCGIYCGKHGFEDKDGLGFPFDPAPESCISLGNYQLDLENAFWNSPFSDLNTKRFEDVEVMLQRAFNGFLWWLQNVKAVGV